MIKKKEKIEYKKYNQRGKIAITNFLLSRTQRTIRTKAKGMI
jgi:hypothetical protein